MMCELHLYSGELPCPWPTCRGDDSITFLGRSFTAVRFAGARGEELYDWVADHRTAAFSLGKLIRRTIAKLNGEPFAGGDRLLYHYASCQTFEAILTSDEMWISDYRALNDVTEISFGRAVADRSFASYGDSSAFRELLSNCLAASLNEAFYVTSFSLHGDCLNQWRAYGDGCKGVAIGFDALGFGQLIACDPQAVSLSRVTYNGQTQALLFETVASVARQIFDLDERRGKHELAILVRELQRIISELLPLCKNPAFEDERECRLVVVPCLTLSGVTTIIDVRHRDTAAGDVAYMTTRDIAKIFRLPLSAVVAGPLIASGARAHVRMLATRHSMDFRDSSAPLRRPPDVGFASA